MKRSTKLFASFALMITSIMMMSLVTYAWFTLSTAPEVAGIKVSIGGDNTIMIANDTVIKDQNGNDVHVPGTFSKNADLEVPDGTLLSPVSTADGLNWFIPSITDSGEMDVSDLSKFTLDNQYKYANTSKGGYAFIDFWIMSPTDHTYLRIASGDKEGNEVGSYVVELPEVIKDSTYASGVRLDAKNDALASSVRVGFLVDDTTITNNNVMNAYMNSTFFREDMTSLKGNYNQDSQYSFLIYEPNGLSHPSKGASVVLSEKGLETVIPKEGEYWVTRPIGMDENGKTVFSDIPTHLIIQTENVWKKNVNTDEYVLEEMYQAFLRQYPDKDLEDFYKTYLQESYVQYVQPGKFFENAWDVYLKGNLQMTDADSLSVLNQTNAVSQSHIVKLDKNVPQKIRMFVWIEGQDVDCSNYSANKTVSVRLEFAGSTGA